MSKRETPRSLRVLGQERACGTCTACCVAPSASLPWGEKPGYVKCEKLRDDKPGCGVYNDRPLVCLRFRCLWIEGMGHKDDRPDKSGLILNVVNTGLPIMRDANAAVPGQLGLVLAKEDGLATQAMEVWKGAARTSGQHMIRDIALVAPIFVLCADGSRFMRGPPQWVAAVAEVVRQAEETAGASLLPKP